MAEGMASTDPPSGELTTRCENCGEVIDVETIFGADREEMADVSDCTLCMDAEEGDYDD